MHLHISFLRIVNIWFFLLFQTVRKGRSEIRPRRGDMCTLNYIGCLLDSTVIEKKEKYEIQIGDGDVSVFSFFFFFWIYIYILFDDSRLILQIIQGVDLVLPLMHHGEICEIQIAARFGFGDMGMAPDIPPNAELLYTVEVASFRPEPDLESFSIQERKEIG